ncbi:MAG: hypothetical protein LAN71_13755 [Acidobacteriia bacterium]|nr:hypothetical protein [Terriglobia bacterium]
MITIDVRSRPFRNFDSWINAMRTQAEPDGRRDFERTVEVSDERIACLGGYQFRELMHLPTTDPISLECWSTERLTLLFVGTQEGSEEFYSIASQIRKRK